ncbi:MAG TPA: hypothetical protein VF598_14890 [Hymenobacter sp.]
MSILIGNTRINAETWNRHRVAGCPGCTKKQNRAPGVGTLFFSEARTLQMQTLRKPFNKVHEQDAQSTPSATKFKRQG